MSRTYKDYGAIYIGTEAGIREGKTYSWRIIPNGDNLLIQRYDNDVRDWVTKSTITG